MQGILSTLTGEEDGYDEAQASAALKPQVRDNHTDLDQSQWAAPELSYLLPRFSQSTDAYMNCSSSADGGGEACEICQACNKKRNNDN